MSSNSNLAHFLSHTGQKIMGTGKGKRSRAEATVASTSFSPILQPPVKVRRTGQRTQCGRVVTKCGSPTAFATPGKRIRRQVRRVSRQTPSSLHLFSSPKAKSSEEASNETFSQRWIRIAQTWAATHTVEPFTEMLEVEVPREVEEQIERDVPRTFSARKRFKSKDPDRWCRSQTNLYKVLRAYAATDSVVGYTQGMSYLAGILLFSMGVEDAYHVFRYMMRGLDMRQYFLPAIPGKSQHAFPRLYDSCEILDGVIAAQFPELAAHFKCHAVQTRFFAIQWFMTLFSYDLHLPFVQSVWDGMFQHGHDFLFAVGAALLRRHETAMLDLQGDDLQLFVLKHLANDFHSSPYTHSATLGRGAYSEWRVIAHTVAAVRDRQGSAAAPPTTPARAATVRRIRGMFTPSRTVRRDSGEYTEMATFSTTTARDPTRRLEFE